MTAALPLYGHADAERIFAEAVQGGRMHHAWLIEGPSGIGKSRFATRIAAWLLGARGPAGAPFDAPASDPVMSRVLSGGHPDLRYLALEINDKGRLKQDISVDQTRAFNEFFSFKPAMGGWRVGIVDALDSMNRASANAILKTLEEPPPAAALLLLSHGTRPVLPTIRSRCRTIRLSLLSAQDAATALKSAGFESEADVAHGRPGLAISRASESCQLARNAAQALLKSMPRPNDALIARAIQTGGADLASFEALRDEALNWLALRAEGKPAIARDWLSLAQMASETEDLNMDPEQAAAKLVAALYASASRG
ncbi:MAG: hypothetical protein R3B98_07040 [Hyphomonas sp.]